MNKYWLKYLGLVGLLGLLGLITGNTDFYGFFGFFGFFAFYNIKSDERLKENINKAAKNAFITTLLIFIVFIVVGSIYANLNIFFYGFILIFVEHIVVFTLSFYYYDKGGR